MCIKTPGLELSLSLLGMISVSYFLRCVLLSTLLLLTACSKTEYADTLEPDALMKLVFKGWQKEGQHSIVKPPVLKIRDGDISDKGMELAPLKVFKLAENMAIMLVRATPTSVDQVSRDVLAAYWFKRDDKKWSLEARQDEIDTLLSKHEIKQIKLVDLATTTQGLLLEYGGYEHQEKSSWTRLYKLGQHQLTSMLAENQDFLSSINAFNNADCLARMKKGLGKPEHLRLDDRDGKFGNCLDIKVKLQIKPGKTLPGDIVLSSSARMVEYHEIAGEDAANNEGGDTSSIYDIIPGTKQAGMVFRYDEAKAKYQLISGSKTFLPDWYRE